MRLYFLNRYFHPDHSATSQMLSDLVFALAARGHRITVVTSRLSYDDLSIRLPPRETVRGVDVVRLATSGFGRTWLAGRAIDYATFALGAAWLLLWRLRRGDVVITKTDPPLLLLLTTPLARLRWAHPVNWLQDIFPETATTLGLARRGLLRGLFALLRRLRDRALGNAAMNVAIGERMADRVRLNVPTARVYAIHNWADGRLVRPVAPQQNSLRREWGLEGDFVIGYSGNLGRAHDIATMLAAIELGARNKQIAASARSPRHPRYDTPMTWLFVGGGAQLSTLMSECYRRGIRDVVFKPYQPREQLSESLSLPDVHLITLRPRLEGLIVPSKYYGIAAAGRPTIFIGDAQGEIARILQDTDTGIVVPEGDGSALASAINSLACDPQRREAMGKRARLLFEARYDLPFGVEEWEAVIKRAADPSG